MQSKFFMYLVVLITYALVGYITLSLEVRFQSRSTLVNQCIESTLELKSNAPELRKRLTYLEYKVNRLEEKVNHLEWDIR